MSDYIAELRRELVDAAERERLRSAPRRALVRTRRPVAVALAGAAALVAAAIGIAVLGREPEPSPATPRIVETIPIGGQPLDAAIGAGAVWVADGTGRVLRVDPRSHRVEATIRAGSEVTAVAASGDAVWAVTTIGPGMHDHQVLGIDPAGNRVATHVLPTMALERLLEVAGGRVWVQSDMQAGGPLQRVDERTHRLVGDFGRSWRSVIAGQGDALWTLGVNGVLERRDAGSGRLLARRPGFAAGQAPAAIAPVAGGAWVATGEDGTVTRVTDDLTIRDRVDLGARGPMTVADGSLWVTAVDARGINAELVRLDLRTGEVLARLRLGARLPRALVAVGDDVWAVIGDGSVLVIH